MNNKRFINPQTINILGGSQNTACQKSTVEPTEPETKQSLWGRFKAKVKRVWGTVISVAEEIKDNIMPIVIGVGGFLANWAAFRYRNSRSLDYNRQRRLAAWA